MNRHRTAMALVPVGVPAACLGVLVAGVVVVGGPLPRADAAPTCNGHEATLVGPGAGGVLTGTEERDVVVTNGATEVDTLGGEDLVCVTDASGGIDVATGLGDDELWLTSSAAFSGAARRAPSAVTIDLGEGNDRFQSFAQVRDTGTGPGGTVDLGAGTDTARITVDDSSDQGMSSDTEGALDVSGGGGSDSITFDTAQTVDLLDGNDGDVDLSLADRTADLAGRTEVAYAAFESQRVLASGQVTVVGTDGADRVSVSACSAVIRTGPGSDRIELRGQIPGQDEYRCAGGPNRIDSGAHGDVVTLEAYAYGPSARSNVPVVYGGSGADTIDGHRFSANAYRAYGEDGNDRILGGIAWSDAGYDNSDVLSGGVGDDVIYGYGGPDRIYGYGGNDRLYGGTGRDAVYGGTGRDLCRAAETRRGCER